MDISSIGFLLVIVIVGGIAGYVGDHLGKKLGKKRLSLMGLRPRHTAALTTVMFGMFLSLLTIVLVLVVSAPVRQWILHGAERMAELSKVSTELKDVQPRLERARVDLKTLNGQLVLGDRKVADDRRQIGDLQRTISGDEDLLKASRDKLARTNESLKQVTAELRTTSGNLAELQRNYRDVEVKNRTVSTENQKLNKEAGSLTKEAALLSKEVADQKKYLSLLRNDDLYARKAFRQVLGAYQSDRLIIPQMQEVARLQVGPNLTPAQARDAVNSLIDLAGVDVMRKGARGDSRYRAADLVDDADARQSAEDQRKILCNKITGMAESYVLFAAAKINIYEGHPVPLQVFVLPNPLVYRRGAVIQQIDLDGRESETDILRTLKDFGTKIREQASKDKMFPVDGDSFGSISADTVLNIVNEAKHEAKMVKLQAVVLSDTHAADPLQLDFRIQ